jgi:hypothetical protein
MLFLFNLLSSRIDGKIPKCSELPVLTRKSGSVAVLALKSPQIRHCPIFEYSEIPFSRFSNMSHSSFLVKFDPAWLKYAVHKKISEFKLKNVLHNLSH